jgi:hypothetical protein
VLEHFLGFVVIFVILGAKLVFPDLFLSFAEKLFSHASELALVPIL